MFGPKYKVGDVVDVNYEGTEYTSQIKDVKCISGYYYYTVENVNNLPNMRMYTNMDKCRIVGLHKESKAEEETMSEVKDLYPVGTYVVYECLGDMGVAKIIDYVKNDFGQNNYKLDVDKNLFPYGLYPTFVLCSLNQARIAGNIGKEYKGVNSSVTIPKFKNGEFVYGHNDDTSFTRFEVEGIYINSDGSVSYYDKNGEDYPESSVYKTKEECIEYVKSLVTFED